MNFPKAKTWNFPLKLELIVDILILPIPFQNKLGYFERWDRA